MIRPLRTWAVPGFLLVCLLLGGSPRGIWFTAVIQLLAIGLIVLAAVSSMPDTQTRGSHLLAVLTVVLLLLIVLQLLPLPPSLWVSFPGRQLLASGYELLDYDLPWMPISLAPSETLKTGYALLAPVAVVVARLRFPADGGGRLAWAVILGALASVFLGLLQVVNDSSRWTYLYDYTNTGAVGVFANRNHMATLLVAAIPFAGALFASERMRLRGRGAGFAALILAAGGFGLVIVGLALNSSLAAIALALPVVAFTALILPLGWRSRRVLIPVAGIALAVAVGALANSSIRNQIAGNSGIGSLYSRAEIWDTTVKAIGKTFPLGTGAGTFRDVYVLHEEPARVDATYVNHAHNDYLELALETGLPGILLLIAFLAWWCWQAAAVWRSPSSNHLAKAATIASAAIMAHSIVDYPLRTSAIAALFATCLVLMSQNPTRRITDQARHVRIA